MKAEVEQSFDPIFYRDATNGVPGIYGPGYAERRRERIKQNYGIDVPASVPNQS